MQKDFLLIADSITLSVIVKHVRGGEMLAIKGWWRHHERQNNVIKFGHFFTQRVIERPNLGFPLIEPNEGFAN